LSTVQSLSVNRASSFVATFTVQSHNDRPDHFSSVPKTVCKIKKAPPALNGHAYSTLSSSTIKTLHITPPNNSNNNVRPSSVVRRSSFVVRRSSFVVRRSSSVVRRSSSVVRRSSFVVRRPSFVVRRSFVVRSSSFVVRRRSSSNSVNSQYAFPPSSEHFFTPMTASSLD